MAESDSRGIEAPEDRTRYAPAAVEQRWYQYWEEQGFFTPPAASDPGTPTFAIVIPPPNVTGVLHLGHALNTTWQDILVRWHRMRGDATLWLPGTDHAGISTQQRVEAMLRERGQSKDELGRERFLAETWAWRAQYGGIILDQLRRLGASVDWTRLRFTLDDGLSRAVRTVFVRLYEEGLIYRGAYMVNWCVHCATALSDIEVEHEEEDGWLWRIRYPAADGGESGLEISTTRPETLLGDTALAVHPEDDRYRDWVGRRVAVPLVGRAVPVISDTFVDPAFGTGVVKVTPAHDPNDYAMGERHDLPRIQVIGEDGCMTAEAGAYAGLTREQARERVLSDLVAAGLLVGKELLGHAVGHCDRCGTVVEPLISIQWFVSMRPLAEPARDAVANGAVTLVPERFTKVYLHWLDNIHDWCISRQLWWGHRIPAYYCDTCGEVTVSADAPATLFCGHDPQQVHQDEDVLDTWFSSALWPFSTLGWPEAERGDLERFYPTQVLSTAYDILFFWVVRMVAQGLHFTGQVPFETVLLHGLIRDDQGRKMSKSAGNGIDPLDVVEEYGADALRLSLVLGTAVGADMRFRRERVEAARNLANKLWNAVRFVRAGLAAGPLAEAAPMRPADAWIRWELDHAIRDTALALERFEFGEAARIATDFLWDKLCDWYIEAVKRRLKRADDDGAAARWTLYTVMEATLRLLHPFMPFVTEELWQSLPHVGASIVVAPFPASEDVPDSAAVAGHQKAQSLVRAVRNLRAELGVSPGERVSAVALTSEPAVEAAWAANRAEILELARLTSLSHAASDRPHPAIAGVADGGTVYLPLAGLVDLARERERLEKDREATRVDMERLARRLDDAGFVQKAPPSVVNETHTRLDAARERAARLAERLEELS